MLRLLSHRRLLNFSSYMLDQSLFSTGQFIPDPPVIASLHLTFPFPSIFSSPCMLSEYSTSRQVIHTGMAITSSHIHQIQLVVHNIRYLPQSKTFLLRLVSLRTIMVSTRSSSLINRIFSGTTNWLPPASLLG